MKKWAKVTVIISNYNGLKLNILTESLESILKNNYPNLEVLLVDNASTDNSVATVKKVFGKSDKLKILQNPINMYSQGLNIGLRNATGDYVAFFNNDVVVDNGYFQKFVTYLDKNSNVGLAQGKLLSYFDHTVIDGAGETTDIVGSPITIGAHQKDGKLFDKPCDILSVSGSCSMLRKSVIEKIGYFDDSYGIGYEDLDLALRARLSGFKVVYYPEVVAYHKRGVTDLSNEIRVKVRWHFNKNRFMTLIKDFPVTFLFRSIPLTILLYIATGLLEIVAKRKVKIGLTRFSSMLWVLLNLNTILKKRTKIRRNATKQSDQQIEKLIYNNTLTSGFLSFLKIK